MYDAVIYLKLENLLAVPTVLISYWYGFGFIPPGNPHIDYP